MKYNNHNIIPLVILALVLTVTFSAVYAAQTISDRLEIDNDDANITLANGDLFGYQIEAIGDLNNDGVIDLATIKFSDDSNEANVGSILILFMNDDGSVSSTNEIVMDGTAGGLNGCIANDSTNRDTGSLEQLAFVGDLDGDGLPTLALGANSNDHPIANSGAVYMLELNANGSVNNCILITEDSNGFDPDIGVYRQSGEGQVANFGWPVIATDLNGDGKNELIVGANSDDDNFTDLWVLFLNIDGTVASHPATPISGENDIGIDTGEYISDGASISGTKIVVSNENDGDGGGSVFIVNLSSVGAFVSVTEIAGSSIAGIANDERFGSGMTSLGDLDGDGIIDILVGNEAGDDTIAQSGEVHILYLNENDTLKESQKISNVTENTRTGETPFADGDLFGHGMTLWKTEGGIATIAISATQDDTGAPNAGAIHLFYIADAASRSGGGGCGGDCTAPTIGLDDNGVRLVDGGFSYNGVAVDAIDFHTPYPLITTETDELNTVTVKVYENNGLAGIRLVQFGLGLELIETPLSNAEVIIEVWYEYGGEVIEDIIITDDENLIRRSSIEVTTESVDCRADSDAQCSAITLKHIYDEAPIYNIMRVEVMDISRNVQSTSFNHGLEVLGESFNPPNIMKFKPATSANYPQRVGLVELIQFDRAEKLWLDPYGYTWQGDSSKMVLLTLVPFIMLDDDPESPFSGYSDRMHSHFAIYKQEQIDRARLVFDSSLIQGKIGDTFAYEFPDAVNRLDALAEKMKAAEMRIIQTFDIRYPGVDRGLSEITTAQ